MSRRLTTVLRVAELREGVARGRLGRAALDVAEAERCAEARRDELAARSVRGGTAAELVASTEVLGRRAQQVVAADETHARAVVVRDHALAEWTEHRRHHRPVEELAQRQRRQEQQARDAAQQRLSDDLAGQRAGQR